MLELICPFDYGGCELRAGFPNRTGPCFNRFAFPLEGAGDWLLKQQVQPNSGHKHVSSKGLGHFVPWVTLGRCKQPKEAIPCLNMF